MLRRFPQPVRPSTFPCSRAHGILCKACDACESFHIAYEQLATGDGSQSPSEAHQDFLRAMLVFAGAGLDSSVKQLVQDALQSVVDCDEGAQKNFTERIRRKLPDLERSSRLLATALTSSSPRNYLLGLLMDDLVKESLQSVDQLAAVVSAFNIGPVQILPVDALREAFHARNQIVHEMDVDLAEFVFTIERPRRSRSQQDMERLTKVILETAGRLLAAVDEKLRDAPVSIEEFS